MNAQNTLKNLINLEDILPTIVGTNFISQIMAECPIICMKL